jgi:hypothetical protein
LFYFYIKASYVKILYALKYYKNRPCMSWYFIRTSFGKTLRMLISTPICSKNRRMKYDEHLLSEPLIMSDTAHQRRGNAVSEDQALAQGTEP